MKKFDITDRFSGVDPFKITTPVETTEKENLYLKYIIEHALDVLLEIKTPQEYDSDLGVGKYSWPKDPKKAAKLSISYGPENFKFQSIYVGFKRNSPDSLWCHAEISLYPMNFPIGVFKMNLNKEFFPDLFLKNLLANIEKKNP